MLTSVERSKEDKNKESLDHDAALSLHLDPVVARHFIQNNPFENPTVLQNAGVCFVFTSGMDTKNLFYLLVMHTVLDKYTQPYF